MLIGEPLRTVVVEPLESPVKQPTGEPEPVLAPQSEPEQVPARVKIPDYISPIVGYRVWRWDATGLNSLNGEPWLPGRPLVADCRAVDRGTMVGKVNAVHDSSEPHLKCTCGVYAAKRTAHLRQFGYEGRGIHGEVYLWGTVVEHKLGWRAQFAYPKRLFLQPDAIPFTLTEIDARLKTLSEFGTDIYLLRDCESVALWKHGSGFDAAGLDNLVRTRKEYYVRRQQERTLKKGDRVAVLGRGIAVVERIEEKEAALVLGNGSVSKISFKDIVLSQRNLRWEYGISS